MPDEREAYRPSCRNPTKTRALSSGFPGENQDIPDLQEGFLATARFINTVTGRLGRRPWRAVPTRHPPAW